MMLYVYYYLSFSGKYHFLCRLGSRDITKPNLKRTFYTYYYTIINDVSPDKAVVFDFTSINRYYTNIKFVFLKNKKILSPQ